MRVHVLYFGVLRAFFKNERDLVDLEPGTDVAGLMKVLRGRVEGIAGVWGSLAVAVNREYAGVSTVLQDGDEVALLPPVSGGCGHPNHRKSAMIGARSFGGDTV